MNAALPSFSSQFSRGNTPHIIVTSAQQEIENFYDQYAPALYGKIKSTLHKEEVCREVLKAAFLNIHQSFDQLNLTKIKPFVLAYNITCKAISRQKIEIVLDQVLHSLKQAGEKKQTS